MMFVPAPEQISYLVSVGVQPELLEPPEIKINLPLRMASKTTPPVKPTAGYCPQHVAAVNDSAISASVSVKPAKAEAKSSTSSIPLMKPAMVQTPINDPSIAKISPASSSPQIPSLSKPVSVASTTGSNTSKRSKSGKLTPLAAVMPVELASIAETPGSLTSQKDSAIMLPVKVVDGSKSLLAAIVGNHIVSAKGGSNASPVQTKPLSASPMPAPTQPSPPLVSSVPFAPLSTSPMISSTPIKPAIVQINLPSVTEMQSTASATVAIDKDKRVRQCVRFLFLMSAALWVESAIRFFVWSHEQLVWLGKLLAGLFFSALFLSFYAVGQDNSIATTPAEVQAEQKPSETSDNSLADKFNEIVRLWHSFKLILANWASQPTPGNEMLINRPMLEEILEKMEKRSLVVLDEWQRQQRIIYHTQKAELQAKIFPVMQEIIAIHKQLESLQQDYSTAYEPQFTHIETQITTVFQQIENVSGLFKTIKLDQLKLEFQVIKTRDELAEQKRISQIVGASMLLILLILLVTSIRNQKKRLQDKPKAKKEVVYNYNQPHKISEKIFPLSATISLIRQKRKQMQGRRHLIQIPKQSQGTWNLGISCIKGNVSLSNQDYGICFEIGNQQVLIIADGVGGVPHGGLASYCGACHAASSLIRTYGLGIDYFTDDPSVAAAIAVRDAYHHLKLKGCKLNIYETKQGLRTTLIVVVANAKSYGYAYIGDGGGYVLRTSGEMVKFLSPQKGGQANVLAASLGPIMAGQPVIGRLPRYSGDMLLAGTDGIFDYVNGIFPKEVLRIAIEQSGDLQKTAEQVTQQLAKDQNADGYICEDNMTLGLMGNKKPPCLAEGFWKENAINYNG